MIQRTRSRRPKPIGRPIATAEQAHQMLRIGVTYKTTAETLANIGLLANRKEGKMASWCTRRTASSTRQRGVRGHIHAGDWEEEVENVEPALKK